MDRGADIDVTGTSGAELAGVHSGGVGRRIARVVGHGLWMLLPVISFGILSWVPAVQAYWRARSSGWLITTLALILATAGFVTFMSIDQEDFGVALWLGVMLGGVVSAIVGRNVVYGGRSRVDPAVHAVLEARARRRRAREIVERDQAMALELGIGRPDRPDPYDDGGLVDLNNVTPDGIVSGLGWSRRTAETLVADRDLRGGYASLAEVGAFSGVDPALLEHDADRIVLLPFRRGGGSG